VHEGEGGERGFWARLGGAHLKFIREFSAEGRLGLADLEQRLSADQGGQSA
jgi:hypothetical protein